MLNTSKPRYFYLGTEVAQPCEHKLGLGSRFSGSFELKSQANSSSFCSNEENEMSRNGFKFLSLFFTAES